MKHRTALIVVILVLAAALLIGACLFFFVFPFPNRRNYVKININQEKLNRSKS